MSDEKERLTSDKVPEKLTEWLLSMGCPPEKVPSLDSAKQMCRGQYYIVWRSLMEEVQPKDSIKYKRLAVFTDDVQKCEEKNVFKESNPNVIVPDELSLWTQYTNLKSQVSEAETRLMQAKQDLTHLIDKVSSKLSQRNLVVRQVQDMERRVLLLQKYSEDLQNKKSDLQETTAIAESMSCSEDSADIESKLDKCLSAIRRSSVRPAPASHSLLSAANPVACSSVASSYGDVDYEELVRSTVQCSAAAMWRHLCERRAGLGAALAGACAAHTHHDNRVSAKTIVAHTGALHCSIALEAMKNKALIKQARKRLAVAVTQLSDYMSAPACEYLVVRCERARAQARARALAALVTDLRHRRGTLAHSDPRLTHAGTLPNARNKLATLHSAIVSKKDELRRSLQSLASIEKKILNIRECLRAVFSCFQNGERLADMDKFRGHIVLPEESIATLQQFYEERKAKQNKMELSLDMDISGNNSVIEPPDEENPKLVDELKIYLDKFSLEKNRKLVLESGDKIWTFESIEASLHRLHKKWIAEELPCTMLCPSVDLETNLRSMEDCVQMRREMEMMLQATEGNEKRSYVVDISSQIAEEKEATDKIKKRLNENIINLQKINRTLDLGAENMDFWAGNNMKNYISTNRTVDGKSYKEYEKFYLDCLRL